MSTGRNSVLNDLFDNRWTRAYWMAVERRTLALNNRDVDEMERYDRIANYCIARRFNDLVLARHFAREHASAGNPR